ncbi:DoxX family protein [Kineosporia succinea]|uniref:Membrane protein YphA (DoxX/SURF4 family) n=1 Tax=Kineosporia succinea TaxID=84632 RepID=A0ABT9NV00_9ACTN|nr:MauE/DoxX family redox-associated membrane protein [Kineosporia succinea]MDP9824259.1 putative membrane protein YphA (DoxX/SURF4 family) [Kineosporia succinea]
MSKRGDSSVTSWQPWVGPVVRLLAGGVFLYTGWAKIQDIDDTIRSVRNYQLLPEAVVPTVGTALPIVELILGALLVVGVLTRFVAVFTALVSLAFFIGVASAWARGLQIECGCFGNSGFTSNPVPGYVRELVLNGAIMAGCAWLFLRGAGRFALDDKLGLTPAADTYELPTPQP